MVVLRFILILAAVSTVSCQVTYLAKNGWQQARLYGQRQPIEQYLKKTTIRADTKRKLELVLEARKFAKDQLGLNTEGNYQDFVELKGPYVTYIVHAAPSFELESYRWWFPIVGHVPYKGYFDKEGAEAEAKKFNPGQFDTYVRGVTAYSTLGWFDDPVWSSMLRYDDHDLVNTVIHESIHATLFIKNAADFNERLATFLGDLGTEIFYRQKEGEHSPTVERIRGERKDQKLFAEFLTEEMKKLRAWYKSQNISGTPSAEQQLSKEKFLRDIQQRFQQQVMPQLKHSDYSSFTKEPLNNARLLSIGTYYEDLSDFEKLSEKIGQDFKVLLAYLKNLSSESEPEKALRTFVATP